MPLSSATWGWVAQSLHAMQCVRWVAWGKSDGYQEANSAIWLE